MPIAALSPSNVAVITGGASGIGLAGATAFAGMGLRVCIVDRDAAALEKAKFAMRGKSVETPLTVICDVSKFDDVVKLERTVRSQYGRIDVLMNNAGIQPGSLIFGPRENWQRVLEVNLWGVINGTQAFLPNMIEQGTPGLVINTGSKQGITTPPGDPAYNIAKAGVKVFTEASQHELRNREGCRISAHLLIPGFVFTGLTAHGRTEKPAGAWTPDQTVAFMIDRLGAGDFYILCPDNEVTRQLDEGRIRWAAGDIIENRPPLSRWHPAYAGQFKKSLDN